MGFAAHSENYFDDMKAKKTGDLFAPEYKSCKTIPVNTSDDGIEMNENNLKPINVSIYGVDCSQSIELKTVFYPQIVGDFLNYKESEKKVRQYS